MNNIRSSHRVGTTLVKKTLAVILVGTFLFTDISAWAGGNSNLSPELRTSAAGFKEIYKAIAICRLIEKDGEVGDVSSINDILTRLRNVKSQFESIHFVISPNEVIVEVPDEVIAIRYFDPSKANTITPYSDIFKLETKVISSKLNRQIIHRVKALPIAHDAIQNPTRVLLVNIVDKEKVGTNYPIGLYALKAYVEKNYPDRCAVEIRDVQLDNPERIIKYAKEWGPEILGLSVKTENTAMLDKFMNQLYLSLPEGERPLCAVGRQAATFGYKDLLGRYPDVVCVRGEGELALAGLIEFVQGKKSLRKTKNIAYIDKETRALVETERELLPDFESAGPINHADLAKYTNVGGNIWIEASRGCPWGMCSFCSISEFWGEPHNRRNKPINAILSELKQLTAMGVERFTFSDEEFIGPGSEGVKRALSIAQAIIDSGMRVSFHADIRAESIQRLGVENLKLLQKAGLKTVFIGMETGSPSQLKRYNKGSNVETAEKAISICRLAGINMAIGFIMIDPLVSKEEILESVTFIRRNKLLPNLSVPLNRLRIYSGEPYIKLIREEEARIGRRLISDKFDRETLIYEIEDYKYPAVKVITDLVTQYADGEYDFYNSIRWFERFNPSIYGNHQDDAFAYIKEAADLSKEDQVELLYQLANLTDEELLHTQMPENILMAAIAKRDKFVRGLGDSILHKGHVKECEDILQQIQKYFAKSTETSVLRQSASGSPKFTQEEATKICGTFKELGIIPSYTVRQEPDLMLAEPDNMNVREGMEVFNDLFGSSAVKIPHSIEVAYSGADLVKGGAAERFIASSLYAGGCTYHLRKIGDNVVNLSLPEKEFKAVVDTPNNDLSIAVKKLNPTYVSVHLGWGAERIALGVVDSHDLANSKPLSREFLLKRITKNLLILKDSLEKAGYDRPVLLETLDYYEADARGAYNNVTDPKFIHNVLAEVNKEKMNVRLLVDAGHLLVAAKNSGNYKPEDFMRYVKDVVNKKTIGLIDEVHVVVPVFRPEKESDKYVDIHQPLYSSGVAASEVKQILKYIFSLRAELKIDHAVIVNFETGIQNAKKELELLADELSTTLSRQSASGENESRQIIHRTKALPAVPMVPQKSAFTSALKMLPSIQAPKEKADNAIDLVKKEIYRKFRIYGASIYFKKPDENAVSMSIDGKIMVVTMGPFGQDYDTSDSSPIYTSLASSSLWVVKDNKALPLYSPKSIKTEEYETQSNANKILFSEDSALISVADNNEHYNWHFIDDIALLDNYCDFLNMDSTEISALRYLAEGRVRIFRRLRHLLLQKQNIVSEEEEREYYKKLNSFLIESGLTLSDVLDAFLRNNQNAIISQSTDAILNFEGTCGILSQMVPLEYKITVGVCTKSEFVKLFDNIELSPKKGDGSKEEELLKKGYTFYQPANKKLNKKKTLIVPIVFDNILSAYRGSAELDNIEAQFLTHAITTAIVKYASKGGEVKRSEGDNAFHEFDLGLMMLEGRNNREVDSAVSLAFFYKGPLPEYARKRTIITKEKYVTECIEQLLAWQFKERQAKENIKRISDWLAAGAIREDELEKAISIIKQQIEILRTQCGLNISYLDMLYGNLDVAFFNGLAGKLKSGETIKNVFEDAIRKYTKEVLISSGREDVVKKIITEERKAAHPWRAAKKDLLDYLRQEEDVRVGTSAQTDKNSKTDIGTVKLVKGRIYIDDKGQVAKDLFRRSASGDGGKSFTEDAFLSQVTNAVKDDIEFVKAVSVVWLDEDIQYLYRAGYVEYHVEKDDNYERVTVVINVTNPVNPSDKISNIITKVNISRPDMFYSFSGYLGYFPGMADGNTLIENIRIMMGDNNYGEKQKLSDWAKTARELSSNAGSSNAGSRQSASGDGYKSYLDKNQQLFKNMLGENKQDILLRIPIEAIETIGAENINDFLQTFQAAPNGYVELYYMSGVGEVAESAYQKYDLQKKRLPKEFKRDRESTLTLFPVLKGEELNQSIIASRLGGINMTAQNTILSPIGLQHDPAGLIRSTILGLKIMEVARTKNMNKDDIQLKVLEDLKLVCDVNDMNGLTAEDIINLAVSTDINDIMRALKKLIKLLPIIPIDAEELRRIYEHAKQVITAA